jgi:hypothetical protein
VSMARLGERFGLSATCENPGVDTPAIARSLFDGRAAVGAACFAVPELTARVWIGDDAGRTGARLLAPALGAREVVLGAAAHAALGRGAPARPWIACGAACDAVDLTLTLLDRLPCGAAVLVGALAGNGRPWPRHWSVSRDPGRSPMQRKRVGRFRVRSFSRPGWCGDPLSLSSFLETRAGSNV